MKDIDFLERQFGGRWCGIRFGTIPGEKASLIDSPMSFCQAIAESHAGPVALTPELLDCPGGGRSIGWNNKENGLAKSMAEKSNIDISIAEQIIKNTPALDGSFDQIIIGTMLSPDLFISHAQPESAMHMIRARQKLTGEMIPVEISGFMSVCGAVAAKAYLTNTMCISFGCPESRKYSALGRDRLVFGISAALVKEIMKEEEHNG
jgi:uncharacterized protein (DUF169 family)